MREAARDVVRYIKGVTYVRFESDDLLSSAVERKIMIIGEAARRVSESFRKGHPEIPWASIIGQRNILAHEYGEILLERVWLVATERLPELIRLLDPHIPPPPKD